MNNNFVKRLISIAVVIAMIMIPTSSYARVPQSSNDYTATFEAEGGLVYFNENNGSIVGCDDSVTAISIPETVNDIPVVKIARQAFDSCKALETVEMTDTITEIAESAFEDCDNLKNVVLSDSITEINYSVFSECISLEKIHIPDSVTSIDNYAFMNCISLKSIDLPASLQSIGYDAFSNCDSITSIVIPKNVGSMSSTGDGIFSNCDSLTDIYFEEGMETIPAYACKGIDERVTVHIPDSVNTLGSLVFNKAGIKSFEIPDTVTTIDYGVFYGSAIESITIPSTVTSISSYVFSECKNLKSAVIESDIEVLPSGMFSECNNLYELELPSSIKTIGDNALYKCGQITDFEWSSGLTAIGENTFYGTGLKEIDFPDTLSKIGYDAFDNCKSLEKIIVPESLTSADSAFSNCAQLETYVFEGNRASLPKGFFNGAEIDFKLELPSEITVLPEYLFGSAEFKDGYELIIPDGVQKISDSCFASSTIDSIDFPDQLTEIGDYAFNYCTELCDINFNDKLTEIGMYAFRKAVSLEEVNFPDSLTKIDSFAFEECSSLTDVYIPENVIEVNGAFSKCNNLYPEHIIFDEELDTLPKGMFEYVKNFTDTYIIPSSIKFVGERAFRFSNIKSVKMHSDIKELRESAFENCTMLEELITDGGLTLIEDCCFEYCIALKELSLTMNEGIIGYKAFNICQNMNFVELYGVKEIGRQAFSSCHKLKEMIIGDGTERIGKECFDSTANLENVRIPATVSYIDGELYEDSKVFDPVIHAPAGSYVEQYAEEYGYRFIDNRIFTDTIIKLPKNIYYTGSPVEPEVIITLEDGTVLEKDVDYSLEYSNNTKIGKGSVTIKGLGYFSGKTVKTFNIDKPLPKITGKTSYTKEYGQKSFYLDSKLSVTGKLTYSSSNKSIVTVSSSGKITLKGPGTAKITVKYAGNSKYSAVKKTVTVKVAPKQIKSAYGTVKSKTSLKYQWKKHTTHKHIIGYQLQYSTDENFKSSKTTNKYLKNINICNTNIKVKNGKTYYVRVRAYTKTGGAFLGGKWSKTDTIRINKNGMFSSVSCETESLSF